jgi:ribosomal protein S18 acetylase RimI-like enzyme
MKEFADSLGRRFQEYFAKYGNEQVHLWLLATHPDFRRRGAGTMLCNWGKEQAVERRWVLTVLACPMGKLLYQALGYKLVGSVIVQVDDEDEKLEVYFLVEKTVKELQEI